MKKAQTILVIVLAGVLMASAGGAAAWYTLRKQQPAGTAAEEPKKEVSEKNAPKYVSLDKVIVMLRRDSGEATSHYMAVDLVFKTPHDKEKITKEQLPLLRSVAVRSLSALSPAKAGAMSVDEIAAQIGRAYDESYDAEQRDKPFLDVMIGKLIIE